MFTQTCMLKHSYRHIAKKFVNRFSCADCVLAGKVYYKYQHKLREKTGTMEGIRRDQILFKTGEEYANIVLNSK